LDTLDEGWSALPDVTVEEMYLFLAIIVEMGHLQRDILNITGRHKNSFTSSVIGMS